MKMYIYCLHVRLGKRNLHYIQPLFLFVQMSIESEMSHQRFRFLLQSGVWHLFPTLSFVCLVQHELSPKCMIMQPCCFTTNNFFFYKNSASDLPHCSHTSFFLYFLFFLFLPVVAYFLPTIFSSPIPPLFLCSIPTQGTQALSQWHPSIMQTPQVQPVPVWLEPMLTVALPAPS